MDNDAAVVYLDTLRRIWHIADEIGDTVENKRPGRQCEDVFPDVEFIYDSTIQIEALVKDIMKRPGLKVMCSNCGMLNDANTAKLVGPPNGKEPLSGKPVNTKCLTST